MFTTNITFFFVFFFFFFNDTATTEIYTLSLHDALPIYGQAYLPRKFKTAFALPFDNCTDVLANDLAYLAVVEDGRLLGYNVAVGGGLGTTPSAGKTFPALAQELTFIERKDVLKIGEAVVKIFRD